MPSRKIEDLHSIFQDMVRRLLTEANETIKDSGHTFFITDGFRSIDEQNKLYAQGRTTSGPIVTNARGGESSHNYGLAVDCAFQKGGRLSYADTLYWRVYPLAKKLGFVLGAEWKDFPDKPHFEYPNWRSTTSPQGGGSSMTDDITIKKKIFEELVSKSTKYDELTKAGIATVSDIEALRRNVKEANDYARVKDDEAKRTREELSEFTRQVAEKLTSPQDLPRILSAIDELMTQHSQANTNSQKDSEENAKYEKQITDLKAEIERYKLLMSSKNPLEQAKVEELIHEIIKRVTAIVRR